MVYTDLAPRQQQFHMAPATSRPNSAVGNSLLLTLKNVQLQRQKEKKEKRRRCSHSFRITCDISAVCLLESREQRYIKAINNNNNNKVRCVTPGRRAWGMKGQPVEGGARDSMPETRDLRTFA